MRVLLFLTYVFVVGLTRLTTAVFGRKYLRMFRNDPEQESFWVDAEGYTYAPKALERQF